MSPTFKHIYQYKIIIPLIKCFINKTIEDDNMKDQNSDIKVVSGGMTKVKNQNETDSRFGSSIKN